MGISASLPDPIFAVNPMRSQRTGLLDTLIPNDSEPELRESKRTYSLNKNLDLESIRAKVREFNRLYRDAAPQHQHKVSEQVARPGMVTEYLKQLHNYVCQLCQAPGFRKRNGSLYAEAHHIIELHHLIPGSYCSDNIVIVCPTCHRKLHYASVSYSLNHNNEVSVVINGKTFSFDRNILPE